ncbi:MAG: alpha/beta fold hydrolase [Nannocystaceae bacterium]|nr:alpha/beta fold hydrolase [bacterium]
MTEPIDDLVVHRYAYSGRVRLHYVENASARPGAPVVLLLHGFPEFWYAWRHQIAALGEAGYRVVAPDLRGYGQSDKPKGVDAYQIERLTDDVQALIAALGEARVSVVGHDWGGLVAWWHAMRHRDSVRTLSVLNCPHPAHQDRMRSDLDQVRRSMYMLFFQLPKLPERRLLRGDRDHVRTVLQSEPSTPGAFTDADIDRYAAALDPASATAALNYYRAYLRRGGDLRTQLRPHDIPTQVIWATGDVHLGSEYANPPSRWVWDVRVERLEGYSHWVQSDAAAEVNRRLLAFLPALD